MHNQLSDNNGDDSVGSQEDEAHNDGDEDTYKVPLPRVTSSKRGRADT